MIEAQRRVGGWHARSCKSTRERNLDTWPPYNVQVKASYKDRQTRGLEYPFQGFGHRGQQMKWVWL